MYDWANSAFMTTIVAAVFPIYFHRVAAADLDPTAASLRFAMATTIGLSIVAVLSPILGAMADFAGIKKKMLGAFMGLGIFATACMFFIQQGDWLLAAVLFVLGNIGASGSFVFYDSLLPHIARADEIDRVSTAGYALGYLGGGTLLAVNLAWILRPDLFGLEGTGIATRLSFFSVAIWWLGFSIPLFRKVLAPPSGAPGRSRCPPPRHPGPCGEKGLRIFVHPTVDDLDNSCSDFRILDLPEPFNGVKRELDYLFRSKPAQEKSIVDAADRELFSRVAAMKDPKAKLSIRNHYVATLKALNRMRESRGRRPVYLRGLKYGIVMDN